MTDTPDQPEDDAPTPEPPAAPQPPAEEAPAEEPPPAPPLSPPPAEPESPPPVIEEAAPSPPPPPPPVVQERPAPPPPEPPPAASASSVRLPWIPILIVAAIVAALLVGVYGWRSVSGGGPQEETYVVQPYTPATELVTARDRVEARAEPDSNARIVVIYGQGVTLNVSGRVQRGLAGDWYAIAWNDQTAFVRTQDVVSGSGAPPAPVVRERRPPPEEEEEKQKPDELTDEDVEVVQPAPSRGVLGVGDVAWAREPSARDFARYFPGRALDDGQSGNVTLSCIIGGGGRLACSVVSESPPGYGFGQAAISISRQLRVRTRLPDGSSAEGRELRLPLSFRAN